MTFRIIFTLLLVGISTAAYLKLSAGWFWGIAILSAIVLGVMWIAAMVEDRRKWE